MEWPSEGVSPSLASEERTIVWEDLVRSLCLKDRQVVLADPYDANNIPACVLDGIQSGDQIEETANRHGLDIIADFLFTQFVSADGERQPNAQLPATKAPGKPYIAKPGNT